MSFRLAAAGDSTIVVELPPRVEPDTNAAAIALAERIRQGGFTGVRDVVSTYHTVAVYFDPLICDPERLESDLARMAASPRGSPPGQGTVIDVPVCYEGELGPDLEEVAAYGRCEPEEVIERHAAGAYRVYMLGFVPGFAYMGIVDEQIAMPRRSTPRLKVPARSVAIANRQTAVYPLATPGGWRLIGRTPVLPFCADRARPFLLEPGDRVRFRPISREEYTARLREAGLHDA